MNIKKVCSIYFSPTGTTEKAVTAVAQGTGISSEKIDLTTRGARRGFKRSFGKDELAVVGMPVYVGRLPKSIDDFFSGLNGKDTPAAALVMYGNRDYEDALIEFKMRLEERGFNVIAGAAFIGEHTFSKNIATGRPNAEDLAIAGDFGRKIIGKISEIMSGKLTVKGNYPFTAKGFDPAQAGLLTDIAHITTLENCTHCGLCIENCPWGAIDDMVTTDYPKCMRCFRCIKICPVAARKVTDARFYEMVPGFESRLNARRKEPELFLPG